MCQIRFQYTDQLSYGTQLHVLRIAQRGFGEEKRGFLTTGEDITCHLPLGGGKAYEAVGSHALFRLWRFEDIDVVGAKDLLLERRPVSVPFLHEGLDGALLSLATAYSSAFKDL